MAALSYVALGAVSAVAEQGNRATVEGSFRSAYDILVRPPGSATELEATQGLVAANYLSSIFGGITREQYNDILSLDGVEIAAPVANVGYIAPAAEIEVPLEELLVDEATQLFRVRQEWVSQQGLSVYPDRDFYVYVTRDNPLVLTQPLNAPLEELPLIHDPSSEELAVAQLQERLPDGELVPVCRPVKEAETQVSPVFNRSPKLRCFSTASPQVQFADADGERRAPGAVNFFFPPILLAAIDPVQEAALLGLDAAVVDGRYLSDGEGTFLQYQQGDDDRRNAQVPTLPVIASTDTFISEQLHVAVERLEVPEGADAARQLASAEAVAFLEGLAGDQVDSRVYEPQPAYEQMLERFAGPLSLGLGASVDAVWTTGPVTYRQLGDRLEPASVDNADIELTLPGQGSFPRAQPPSVEDADFRGIRQRQNPQSGFFDAQDRLITDTQAVQVVGRYDPSHLAGFSSLSQVPLQSYYPPELRPGDRDAHRALGEGPLRPTMDLGGYQTQPPLMLTTLDAIAGLYDGAGYPARTVAGRVDPNRPISSIRVRVAGVDGPTEANRNRIDTVATAIAERTGLDVDITIGSSPHEVIVELPEGDFGRPQLTLIEDWVKKGVSFAVLAGLDRKSSALFIITQLVAGLFVANGAAAAVRSRRTEIGTLRSLGWSGRDVFQSVLTELAVVGMAAGAVGAAAAAVAVRLTDLPLPLWQTLTVAPIATSVAVLAGVWPATIAARIAPLAAIRPPMVARATARPVGSVRAMAWRNLARLPGRTALGAVSLALGVAALATLLAVNLAYQGLLVDTRLGVALSEQIRPADYATAGLAIALGALSIADVLYLNLRERAAELTVLRVGGWSSATVRRLGLWEGCGIAMLGGGLGVALGLLSALLYAGRDIALAGLGAAVLAAVAAAALTVAAALVVVTRLTRGSAAVVLAEAG